MTISFKSLERRVNLRLLLLIACLRSCNNAILWNSMAMGLLARLRVGLEEARQSNTVSFPVSVSVLFYITGQAVLLMGLTSNTVFCHRRLIILSSLMNPQQAKSLLKNKAAILQSQYVNLVGKELR